MFSALNIAFKGEDKVIHSAQKNSTCFKMFAALKYQTARNLQLRMDPVLVSIIDEF